MKTIDHWTIQITWSDGEKEFLDYIPESPLIEIYLDVLEKKRNEILNNSEVE